MDRTQLLTRTRAVWLAAFAAATTVALALLAVFRHLPAAQVALFGWLPLLLLACYAALQAGPRDDRKRTYAFFALGFAGLLLGAYLVLVERFAAWKVALFGLLPLLAFAGIAARSGKRVAPYRVVQVLAFAVLNAFVLAYLRNRPDSIIYTGVFKYIPEPILNCYGGPMAVFACPIGSFQQMIGQPGVDLLHRVPWLPIGVFVVIGALVGRGACAWLCPFGLWQDLLYKVKAGPRAGRKRWLGFGVVAGLGLAGVLLLSAFVHVSWWKSLLFAWLPFTAAVLYVVLRGKMELPRRLWLGGWLAGVGLGVLVWFKFEPSYGVASGAVAMSLLGLTGGWFALALGVPAAFLVGLLGPAFHLGPLSGVGLGIAAAFAVALPVVVLDRLVDVRLRSTLLKYAFLVLVAGFVAYKTGEPWFCKLCPQGTLGAGIPLVLWNPVGGLRDLVGWLYYLKVGILLAAIVLAMAGKRPFCRVICPIGAVYSVFNKVSLLRMRLDKPTCTGCSICRKVCPMDIEPHENPNQLECIRCSECTLKCPKSSLKFTT